MNLKGFKNMLFNMKLNRAGDFPEFRSNAGNREAKLPTLPPSSVGASAGNSFVVCASNQASMCYEAKRNGMHEAKLRNWNCIIEQSIIIGAYQSGRGH